MNFSLQWHFGSTLHSHKVFAVKVHSMASPETEIEKPLVNLDGIAIEWEKCEPIRQFLRANKSNGVKTVLFGVDVNESVKTAVVPHVHSLLVVLFQRMCTVEGHPQPTVEPLRDQIKELYRLCSVLVDDSQVVHDSWVIRKFCSFIQMKARLELPSTVSCLKVFSTYRKGMKGFSFQSLAISVCCVVFECSISRFAMLQGLLKSFRSSSCFFAQSWRKPRWGIWRVEGFNVSLMTCSLISFKQKLIGKLQAVVKEINEKQAVKRGKSVPCIFSIHEVKGTFYVTSEKMGMPQNAKKMLCKR